MKTFKQFDEIIDLKKVKRGHDPMPHGFIVVSKDDVVIYRGSKWEAEKFLKNKNNAYRLGRKHKKVYNSRQLEVGDKWNPKLQVKFDKSKDIVHMHSINV
jgi:hypothetical protein